MSGKLILIRHGESEWNALGKWTGWTDVSITDEGTRLSRELGEKLGDVRIDVAYNSELKRTKETLDAVLEGGVHDVHLDPHVFGQEVHRVGVVRHDPADLGRDAYVACLQTKVRWL